MKKTLWRKILVCNTSFDIYKVEKLSDCGCLGVCDPIKNEILIEASLKGHHFMRVLYHELIHALTEESGLGEILDYQAKEMVAETFAGFLTAVARLK